MFNLNRMIIVLAAICIFMGFIYVAGLESKVDGLSSKAEFYKQLLETRKAKIAAREDRIEHLSRTIRKIQEGNKKYRISVPSLTKTEIYVVSRLAVEFEERNKYSLKAEWILAMIQQESLYNKYAISNHKCVGLMQLYPPTAERVATKHNFKYNNLQDVRTNVQLGIWYIEDLLDLTEGDILLSLHMYNWGEFTTTELGANEYPYKVQKWEKRITGGFAWTRS
jgi:soluble lytic murein transglycosylase-like protein